MLDPLTLLALCGVGILAGFCDAIAGGGGLIAVPALLAAGVPPVAALATTKLQSVIGTAAAALTYWRKGFVSLRPLLIAVPVTLAAAYLGAVSVNHIDASLLQIAMPITLIVVALYFLLSPKLGDVERHSRLRWDIFVPVMGAIIGFYDGFFGPGAGSLFTLGFVALFGLGMTRAAGHTKILNLASNLGALALFIPAGQVLWPAALVMAVGQLVGGYLGARTGIRFGARIIRPLVVVVSVALALKLLFFR
jgi:uncharacterized membrane protein YfcA